MTMTKEEAQRAYDALIFYRQQNILIKSKEHPGRIEIHHIIPLSIGGIDEDSNKVALLAKEHFMAHVYLWIIHHDDQFHNCMTAALMNMHKGTKNGSRKELREYVLMSKDYQQAKEEFGKFTSKMFSNANKGENNSQFGKHWYKDPNSKQCSLFNEGQQPIGWIRGKYLTENECNNLRNLKNDSRVWICNDEQHINKFVTVDIATQLTSTGQWRYGHLQKPMSKTGLLNIRASLKTRQYSYCQQDDKSKLRYFNEITKEIKYFAENEQISNGFERMKRIGSYSDEDQAIIRAFNHQQNAINTEKWLKCIQNMADYFMKYGYEATCKKFNINTSLQSLVMKFIRARNLYGIHFESQSKKKHKI